MPLVRAATEVGVVLLDKVPSDLMLGHIRMSIIPACRTSRRWDVGILRSESVRRWTSRGSDVCTGVVVGVLSRSTSGVRVLRGIVAINWERRLLRRHDDMIDPIPEWFALRVPYDTQPVQEGGKSEIGECEW